MSYDDVAYEDEDLYVLEHEMGERILYSAYEAVTDKPLVFNRPSVKEAVKAARKELEGVQEPTLREHHIQSAKKRGHRLQLPSGKKVPNWLLLLHEETHNRLGHSSRHEGWAHKQAPSHIIGEEEDVWRETAKVLKKEGKWTPEVMEIGIEVLSAYYDDIKKARRLIEEL